MMYIHIRCTNNNYEIHIQPELRDNIAINNKTLLNYAKNIMHSKITRNEISYH